MKIGIYNPRVGIADAGGTETFLREMISRLQENHEIVLYCGSGDLLEDVRDFDIKIREIEFKAKENRCNEIISNKTPLLPAEIESLTMYWNARKSNMFQKINGEVDVISTHYYIDNILLDRTVSVPTLFRFPGIKQPSIRWKGMANLAKPDIYLANSEATASRVRNWLNINVDGIVYAGVDTDQFNPDVEPAFKTDGISILYVGRLDKGKGLYELLEARSRLDYSSNLYIVGDGTIRSDLENKVKKLGIEDAVSFVGSIDHNEIQHYYSAADIFCLPSHHESLGIVNLEAMATGTPVVSTEIDAIEEYIDKGENGLLVPPKDVDELTRALERMIAKPKLRERLSSEGLKTAIQFSWDNQAEKMEDFYTNLIG